MQLRNDRERWGSVAQAFHWLIVLLILAQGTIGLVMVTLPKKPSVFAIYNLHKSIGLTILALAVLRIAWRLFDGRPRHLAMPGWQRRVAVSTHAALYVLLFAVPLSGWLFDSASALRPLHWWGVVRMPSLTGGPAPQLRHFAAGLHQTLFWCLVGVTVLHTAAALQHHFVHRDATLRRMLPGGRGRRRTTA